MKITKVNLKRIIKEEYDKVQEEREVSQMPDGSAVAQVIDLLENLESELHIEAGTSRRDSHEKQQFAETAGRLRQMVQQALQLLSQAAGGE